MAINHLPLIMGMNRMCHEILVYMKDITAQDIVIYKNHLFFLLCF